MKNTVFWALAALNVVLIVAVLAPYFQGNQAMAQRAGSRRPEMIMIPGEVVGGNSAVVYLVDTANRKLGAVTLNARGNGLDSLDPQLLERVFSDRAVEPENGKGGKK